MSDIASTDNIAVTPSTPAWITLLLAMACGLIVANFYYAQPLIGLISHDLGMSPAAAGLIVTMTQIGYGAGLLLLVPLGDLVENRKLVLCVMSVATLALVGTLFAESYRLGPRGGTAALASLEPRDPAPLPGVVWTARGLLAAAALGAVALSLWVRDTATVLLAVGGLLVTGLAEATRARIVGRRRPVLSFRARELDARIRAFAGRSVANLQLAAALLVVTGVVASVPVPGPVPTTLRWLVWLVGFVLAWVYTHRAAPRPPSSWRQPR